MQVRRNGDIGALQSQPATQSVVRGQELARDAGAQAPPRPAGEPPLTRPQVSPQVVCIRGAGHLMSRKQVRLLVRPREHESWLYRGQGFLGPRGTQRFSWSVSSCREPCPSVPQV